MNIDQVRKVVARISYKPNATLAAVEQPPDSGNVVLLVNLKVPDTSHHPPPGCPRRTIMVTHPHPVPVEFLRDHNDVLTHVREAVHCAELHEADEWIRVGDRAPFDPHARTDPQETR